MLLRERIGISTTSDEKLTAVEWPSALHGRFKAERLLLVNVRPVPLDLLCCGCGDQRSSSDLSANIEVLEEIKLHDGDAFRSGDVPVTYPPMPQIDRETHWRASMPDSADHDFDQWNAPT